MREDDESLKTDHFVAACAMGCCGAPAHTDHYSHFFAVVVFCVTLANADFPTVKLLAVATKPVGVTSCETTCHTPEANKMHLPRVQKGMRCRPSLRRHM